MPIRADARPPPGFSFTLGGGGGGGELAGGEPLVPVADFAGADLLDVSVLVVSFFSVSAMVSLADISQDVGGCL